jgi:hypothetical protein
VSPCSRCDTRLALEAVNTAALATCSACGATLQADVYPALFNGLASGHTGDRLQSQQEAGCFYHPDKRAQRPCSACGRFMCALCDIELEGRHLCPACLEKGKSSEQISQLVDRRVCYDQIALLVAFLPIFMVWVTIVTAPIALYLSIRYWNTPTSIVPRTRIRFVVAIVLSALQMFVWAMVFLT